MENLQNWSHLSKNPPQRTIDDKMKNLTALSNGSHFLHSFSSFPNEIT